MCAGSQSGGGYFAPPPPPASAKSEKAATANAGHAAQNREDRTRAAAETRAPRALMSHGPDDPEGLMGRGSYL